MPLVNAAVENLDAILHYVCEDVDMNTNGVTIAVTTMKRGDKTCKVSYHKLY